MAPKCHARIVATLFLASREGDHPEGVTTVGVGQRRGRLLPSWDVADSCPR
jgi:hypothetical protein